MLKIYHNPRCSKSRKTLEVLSERALRPTVIEYLKAPPSIDELDSICVALGKEPRELMRAGEARFAELGLALTDVRPRAEWLRLMHENPILIERPIVVHGARAAIGRPPEKVLEIL